MRQYIGETEVAIKNSVFKDYTRYDWALYWISVYGGFDGAHHKDWVLDQVARILNGTPVLIKKATWSDGSSELRVSLGNPSQKYHDWVNHIMDGNIDDYSIGIAP